MIGETIHLDEEVNENAQRPPQIGNVKLDYSHYPGEDLYSDGAIEDELMRIARDLSPVEYPALIGEKKSWPILYHFSAQRGNIVEWIPIPKDAKVLEVGSGCGAITGTLASKAGSVTCVELSKRRSLINAYRNSDRDNVNIHVGNFRDIEPELPNDFDFIFLIGVFEYGQSYIDGDSPFEDFLKILLPHLKKDGRIVIAIENKYGLKYFAGCKEDHLGTYFSNIENYVDGGGVRTFSRKGLEKIFEKCDVKESHFYYPYPDYKFMVSLYSDKYQPRKGELCNNLRNFDNDRMVLFDEKNAFDGLIKDGLFPVFSNSYLVVIGPDLPVEYVKYSNDRAPGYSIKTQITRDDEGKRIVRKYPMDEAAKEHVISMETAYKSLKDRYEGGKLRIDPCLLGDDGNPYAEFEYVEGVPLVEIFDEYLEKEDIESFQNTFREFVERIDYNSDAPVCDFDMIFGNILVNGDEWTVIDYEWTFGKQIPTNELAFRAIYYYIYEDAKREKIPFDWVLEELDITEDRSAMLWEQEKEFQNFIRGKHVTLSQMRDLLDYRLMDPRKWIEKYKDTKQINRVQIYEDTGNGHSEEQSYFVREAYHGDQLIDFELKVSGSVNMLRIDPMLDCCLVKILAMTWNGERVPLEKKKVLLTNGRVVKPADKEADGYQPSFVFATEDPNISINIAELTRVAENTLYTQMEIVRIPKTIAEDMAASIKKLI